MGAPFENSSGAPPNAPIRPSEITDDTQLTLATCEALIAEGGCAVPDTIAREMARWFAEGRLRGVGASTLKALRELKLGAHWALVGRKGDYAAGAGAAMRIGPLGFVVDPDYNESRRLIRDTSRITHHSEEAYVGSLAVVYAVRRLASDSWRLTPSLAHRLVEVLPDAITRDRLQQLDAIGVKVMNAAQLGTSGYVADVVPMAIATAVESTHLGFYNAIQKAINAGGDTDTIASIAGQIIGASIGQTKLPEHLLLSLKETELIVPIAQRLHEVMRKSVDLP